MQRFIISLCTASFLSLTACQAITKPTPFGLYRGMEDNVPSGTPIFQAGWKAGCESGISAMGSLHHKATHSFTYDTAMLNSNEYHNAWRLAFRYCRWYTAGWVRPE